MEGVTYSMRDSLEIIQGMNVPVKQVRVSGGGSRSKLWRQLQADVFGTKAVTINAEQGAGIRLPCWQPLEQVHIRTFSRHVVRPFEKPA